MTVITLCRTKAKNKGDLPAAQLAQKLHGLGGAIDRDGYHSTMEGEMEHSEGDPSVPQCIF